jgi:sugar phosphate isomerase/epimerase
MTENSSFPTFSVSEFTTWHQSFEEDVKLYHALGIEGIEICERKLSTDYNEALNQLAIVREYGLKVTSVQPRVHALFKDFMCPDIENPEERHGQFRQSIDLFSEAFPDEDLILVTISGSAPEMNFQSAHKIARELYPDLADYAAEKNVRIMYEPLSPVLMNNDTFTCTMHEAMDLIEDVNRSNFGLMLDVYHVWREPVIYNRIEALDDRLFGVHLSDWPEGEPRHPGDRRICGEGVIDFPRLLGAIEKSGYRGAYCLEIFSIDELPDSLWQADPSEVIRKSRSNFEAAWEKRHCD